MDKLYVIKIGGNVIDEEKSLSSFLKDFSAIPGMKILIHGGGKLATRLAEQLGIKQQLIDGRRITDEETLKIVTMVYAGHISKNIVAQLQANGCNAIGLSGADGNFITAHKRRDTKIDYGFAGDIDNINTAFVIPLLQNSMSVVVSPITHDQEGQLLNTNADTIAQEIAKALSPQFAVHLIYCFDKNGVLLDMNDESSVINLLTLKKYQELKQTNAISDGMIPKLDNAFTALTHGVKKVLIGKASDIHDLVTGKAGTTLVND